MHPADFDYLAPSSLDEAIDLLAAHPDARVLAGGQSLIPILKLRLGGAGTLVDLRRLDDLRYVRETNGGVEIGALTTYREVASSPLLRDGARALAEAAAAVGDMQVRNRGTFGGGLAHADPAADVPAAAVALGCTMTARGRSGSREIPVAEFFRGVWATALEPGEILTAVRVPIASGSKGAYEKLVQKASGFALVGAAAVLEMDGETCRSATVALTGVGMGPVRLGGLGSLAGAALDPAAVESACEAGAAALDGVQSDLHASHEYRRAMAAVVARRAILRAAG